MGAVRNVLFVMYDQLRFDYLGCAGHPFLKTPNFDRIASKGVRFTNAYVQSPVCGPSRMSFYTGRYSQSHGASGNFYPLRVGELTMGDHLREVGVDCWLVGKTHVQADIAGMARLGIDPDSTIGARVAEGGFDVWVRHDGTVPDGPARPFGKKPFPYNEWLKSKGYPGENPWHQYANSGIDADGNIASGWLLKNSRLPANIREEDSETPWLTSEAIRFIEQKHDRPWVCHVSYIKPHWPYIVPEPYASMYGPEHVIPAVRSEAEKQHPHPVYGAFMNGSIARTFASEGVREEVIPAYMGLIAQCDVELGRLIDYLEQTGQMDETMIVVTSDHGDYLGDHWLGEKDLFHEQSAKVPLIIYDPSAEADSTRGTVCDALVEAIDLLPTFLDVYGAKIPSHVLEGRSLLGWVRNAPPEQWRNVVFSEYDYTMQTMSADLGKSAKQALLFMVFDGRYKMMHAEGFRPMLFDLETDPEEISDVGSDPAYAEVIDRLYEELNAWARRNAQRVTVTDERLYGSRGRAQMAGIFVGVWGDDDVLPEVRPYIEGKPEKDYRGS